MAGSKKSSPTPVTPPVIQPQLPDPRQPTPTAGPTAAVNAAMLTEEQRKKEANAAGMDTKFGDYTGSALMG